MPSVGLHLMSDQVSPLRNLRTPTNDRRLGQGHVICITRNSCGFTPFLQIRNCCIFPVATLATLLHPYGVFVVDVAEALAPSATSTNS